MYENITFESILERMLERVPESMDKREGSVVYDALAPAAIELQLMYIELDNTLNELFADTATREYLIRRAKERGLKPKLATQAVVQGLFTPSEIEISIGSRFNLDELNYAITDKVSAGIYKLKCETIGTIGNQVGTVIPIEEIERLETAQITELLIPGENDEDTELFRDRYFDSFYAQAFGGNVADYKWRINDLDGVGECKIYRAWNGGGTVKAVIMNSEYKAPSQELINSVQTAVDPIPNQGEGLGLAPIGHVVTIEGVESATIDITSTITFVDGQDINSAINSLRKAIDDYFLSLCKKWQDSESIVVRISQIEYSILNCPEVVDVTATQVNGSTENMTLLGDEIPERGKINGI